MVFSSPIFLFLFLPLVLGVCVLAPRPAKNLALLVAGLVFYAWGENLFVMAMLGSIAVNYVLGLWVDRVRHRYAVGWVVALAVVANLALVVRYKYLSFNSARGSWLDNTLRAAGRARLAGLGNQSSILGSLDDGDLDCLGHK